jgi:site-specific recombinase XerD
MRHDTTESIDTFINTLSRGESSPSTYKGYRFDLMHFRQWYESSTGEAFSPTSITPTDIRDYRSYLLTVERRAPATIKRHLAALRKFCQWAIRQGLLKENPTDGVKGIASAPRAPRWLDKRDVDRLLRACERGGNKRDLAILSTLRHTGIRVGELCTLRPDDLTINERSGELIVRSGKGSKHRVIPLNLDARKALQAYLQVRPQIGTPQLFIGQRGNGLTSLGVEKIVRKYAYQAGLQDVTPHTLRHSFGKHALDSGSDLVAVSTLLGHQRLETTAIYTTPSRRDLEQAVRRLERDQV